MGTVLLLSPWDGHGWWHETHSSQLSVVKDLGSGWCLLRAPSAQGLARRCLTVPAGDSGPVPVPRHSGAQGPEHGERRGEQVWRHQLPVLLPAVSEWLCHASPCVSAVLLSPLLPLWAHPFFLPEEAASLSQGMTGSFSCESSFEYEGRQGLSPCRSRCLPMEMDSASPIKGQGPGHFPQLPAQEPCPWFPGQPAPVLQHHCH